MPVGAAAEHTRAVPGLGDPVQKLLGLPEGGGEGHHLHVPRQVHEGLLPHRSPLHVVDVVDLVAHHAPQPLEVRVHRWRATRIAARSSLRPIRGRGKELRVGLRLPRRFDELVAEDLRSADQKLILSTRRGADLHISRQERHLGIEASALEPVLELRELLVAERLDGRRVHGPLPASKRLENAHQRDGGLAGPCGSHEHEVLVLIHDHIEAFPLVLVDRVPQDLVHSLLGQLCERVRTLKQTQILRVQRHRGMLVRLVFFICFLLLLLLQATPAASSAFGVPACSSRSTGPRKPRRQVSGEQPRGRAHICRLLCCCC
mmetsp:Transcript_23741/g.69508  ORF Transcript_23741/g.69508 Transcript_23741/m.69508 type:complete len:317 (+) Transcript_23741:2251-3201(+)